MSNLTCDQAFSRWAEPGPSDAFRSAWRNAMDHRPPGVPPHLDPDYIKEVLAYAGVDPAELEPVLRMAEEIRRDEALAQFYWCGVHALYVHPAAPVNGTRDWPRMEAALGAEGARYFYFLVVLASVARVRTLHRERGIPENVTRDTCSDVRRFRPCLAGQTWALPDTLAWFRNAAVGDLFRIGRHQYVRGPFRGRVFVFRRRASGEVVSLAAAGQRFNADGFCDCDGGVRDPDAWDVPFEMDERQVRGVPVAPTGRTLRHDVRLDLKDWSLLMTPDTPVLQMHIPRDGPMPPAASGASMLDAVRFFPRYLSERTFRACTCVSWLFNPRWQEVLGPDSNIAAWQREVYLFPMPSEAPAGLQFIFGFDRFDLRSAPRDSRLRRAAAAWLEAGEPVRTGGMFALTEDLPDFGEQPYLRDWPRVRRRLGLPA